MTGEHLLSWSPRVENDREVEKSGVGGKVMSATHNAFGRSAAKFAADEVAGGTMDLSPAAS